MVSRNYMPSMRATVESGKDGSTSIKCSDEYVNSLRDRLSLIEREYLEDNVAGQAICPRLWWFNDTPQIRQILRVEDSADQS